MANINLSKTPKINLTKGQVINLTKDGTNTSEKLHKVFFGASWSGKHGKSIDLDASLICYNNVKEKVETIYFGHKVADNNSIRHSGDDLWGGNTADADNETISIHLDDVQSNVQYIVAVLHSYSGESFDTLYYIRLRIYTGKLGNPDEVLCAYQLDNNPDFKNKQSIVLGFFTRTLNGWKFKADGRTGNDTRIIGMVRGIAYKAISGETSVETHVENPRQSITVTVQSNSNNVTYDSNSGHGLWNSIISFFKNLF